MILRRGRRMARATTAGPGRGAFIPAVISVRMKPGSTSTRAMLSRRSSRRSASERPRTPNFVPEYRALTPISPATDPMLTITPRPCRRIWGSTAWTQRAGASRLTATICCITLSRASMGLPPPTPALLTSTSIRPYASIVLSTSRSTSVRAVTSVGTARARPPCRTISSASAWIRSARRAASTTAAPWRASSRAVAAPIPLEAPVTTATLPRISRPRAMCPSHPEHAVARRADGSIEAGRDGQAQGCARVGGIGDAVVPQARRAVVGAALDLVLLQRGPHEFFLLRGRHVLATCAQVIQPHLQEHRGRLLAAHHRDARVGPHPQEARVVSAAAHGVVARAKRATDDDGELGDRGVGDGRHHLGAVLGYPAALVRTPHHEAGDVLQEEQGDAALITQLDEVRALERAFGEEDAVVGHDADGKALDAREAADERGAVEGLELVQAAAVDEAGDDLAHVIADAAFAGVDAVDLPRRVAGLLGP